jgi:hypothetical protein
VNGNQLRLPLAAAIAAMLTGTLLAPASADTPGPHPYYVHALSDLRHAAALENHPDEINVVAEQRTALADIRTAIAAATQAAGDDAKNLNQRFPVDGPQDRHGRLLRARSDLRDALRDLQRPEANPAAVVLRDEAIDATRQAIAATDAAMRDDRIDDRGAPPHPAELHALTDLRLARAYLNHPEQGNVQYDDAQAIGSIDAAIADARAAAYDDGKNLADHPAEDANLSHRGRLQRALSLLASASHDLGLPEADRFARGDLGAARADISRAYAFVQQAIRDDRFDNRHGA